VPLATSILQSRIFSYNCLLSTSELYTAPKLSHVDYIFSQSGLFHISSVASPKFWGGQIFWI